MEWISVNERLPDNDDDVLIADVEEVRCGYWSRVHHDWCEYFMHGADVADPVTHWMPLPDPPIATHTSTVDGSVRPADDAALEQLIEGSGEV